MAIDVIGSLENVCDELSSFWLLVKLVSAPSNTADVEGSFAPFNPLTVSIPNISMASMIWRRPLLNGYRHLLLLVVPPFWAVVVEVEQLFIGVVVSENEEATRSSSMTDEDASAALMAASKEDPLWHNSLIGSVNKIDSLPLSSTRSGCAASERALSLQSWTPSLFSADRRFDFADDLHGSIHVSSLSLSGDRHHLEHHIDGDVDDGMLALYFLLQRLWIEIVVTRASSPSTLASKLF